MTNNETSAKRVGFAVKAIAVLAENQGKDKYGVFGEILQSFPETDVGFFGHRILEENGKVCVLLGVYAKSRPLMPEEILEIIAQKMGKTSVVFEEISLAGAEAIGMIINPEL